MAVIALCACSVRPQIVPTRVTAQQVLTRYRDAVGRCPLPGVWYFGYRTATSQGEVFTSDYFVSRGRGTSPNFRLASTVHGVRSEQGQLSGRVWMQTPNGLVLPDAPRQTPFDRALSAATRKPDQRVRMLGITTGADRQYVIEIAPNARLLQRRYFDAGNFLLRKIQTRNYDNALRTDSYSRYVNVCGLPVAARIDHSDSLSSQTYATTLVRHQRLADPQLLAIPRSRTPFVPQGRLPATLNSLFGTSGILIRVDIQGDPYWFQLDSGSSDVTMDRDLVQRLGGREFGELYGSKGGTIRFTNAVVPRLDIGPVYATNFVVSVINHDFVKQGVHVVGLLGCDFIASRVLDIDFRSQTVVLADALPSDRQWTRVKTPLASCRPTVHVRFENQPATLVLDTGAPDTIINEDLYDEIASSAHALGTMHVTYLGGESLDATQYVVPSVSAGALSLGPIVTSVVTGGRGQDLDNDGFIGLNVLDNYRVVMDYRNEQTYFQEYPPK